LFPPSSDSIAFCRQNIGADFHHFGPFQLLNFLFAQAWWLNRRRIELSLVHRASMCFVRRLQLHAQACVYCVNQFTAVVSALAADCGLSRRDVSQCVGPFDQVLACLSRIQEVAVQGKRALHSRSSHNNHIAAATLRTSGDEAACSKSFNLDGVCASITSSSPVFCSFCSLAPSLISHIDTLRVMPSVSSYLEDGGRCSCIRAAFTRVLVFVEKVFAAPLMLYLRFTPCSSVVCFAGRCSLGVRWCRLSARLPQARRHQRCCCGYRRP
jgi:hypothetical protein